MFTNAHNAAVSPETRLLSAFAKDTQARKVDLTGRGESSHVAARFRFFFFFTRKQAGREKLGQRVCNCNFVPFFLRNYLKYTS